jgi:dihydroxyacetone kinase-like protein
MDPLLAAALIRHVAGRVIAAADTLTALDQAIGDGDHGLNMKRGFEAVLAQADALAQAPWPELLKGVGTTLVMKVGGASGPLYGTLFMTLGKQWPQTVSAASLADALGHAIDAIRRLGKAEPGQKTLLDVLVPVRDALTGGADAGRVAQVAADAAAATVPMRATKGRASFLGERSIGHTDPGAQSAALIVAAIRDALAEAPRA